MPVTPHTTWQKREMQPIKNVEQTPLWTTGVTSINTHFSGQYIFGQTLYISGYRLSQTHSINDLYLYIKK